MKANDMQWYAKHEPEIEELKAELTTPLSSDITWHAKYEPKMEEVKVELTTPLSSDITCHDLYFMMIKYHHIHRYPRRFKKAFFYGTKNEKMLQKIRKEICKYCVIETKETIL